MRAGGGGAHQVDAPEGRLRLRRRLAPRAQPPGGERGRVPVKILLMPLGLLVEVGARVGGGPGSVPGHPLEVLRHVVVQQLLHRVRMPLEGREGRRCLVPVLSLPVCGVPRGVPHHPLEPVGQFLRKDARDRVRVRLEANRLGGRSLLLPELLCTRLVDHQVARVPRGHLGERGDIIPHRAHEGGRVPAHPPVSQRGCAGCFGGLGQSSSRF